jgi:hypothetical protein
MRFWRVPLKMGWWSVCSAKQMGIRIKCYYVSKIRKVLKLNFTGLLKLLPMRPANYNP